MKSKSASATNKMHCPHCWKWGEHARHRDSTGKYVYTCPHCGKTQVFNN